MVRSLEDPGSSRLYWLTSRLSRYFAVPNDTINETGIEDILNYEEPESITPPTPPTGNPYPSVPRNFAAATGSSSGEIDLSWTAPQYGAPFTEYSLWVSEDGASWTDSNITDITGDATSYTVTGITAGAERSYLLTAHNASGIGGQTDIATANAGS